MKHKRYTKKELKENLEIARQQVHYWINLFIKFEQALKKKK
jgi:hypothetical protein